MTAFNEALALESVSEELKCIDKDHLIKYTRIIAYKVFS